MMWIRAEISWIGSKMFFKSGISWTFILIFTVSTYMSPAQDLDTITDSSSYMDKTDLMNIIRGKKSKNKSTGIPQKGKIIGFPSPIFGSNPSLGTFYGFGATGAVFLGEPENTSISNFNLTLQYTTKKQMVTSLKGILMTPENKWEMLVDLKYSIFSEGTYGLGSDYNQPIKEGWNIGGIETEGIGGVQQINFNYLKLHYTLLRETLSHLYFGVGYHLDWHTKIVDKQLDLEASKPVVTSHYFYSVARGFNPNKYTSSGISLNTVYDSRDHTVNPYKGSFSQFSYRINPGFLGSSQNYQQLYLETRLYQALSKKVPRHLISFWAIGQFITSGFAPYLDLPASSYDMRNRIGRGYVAARFRGKNWVTAETEYRFPVTKNGLLGGVVFASVTSTSREESQIGGNYYGKLKLFEAIRPAGGFGARIMLNRTGRLNLTADMAFGQNGSKGFYFSVGETF
jgi:outer membrane protein assembly factor BamA